MVNGREACSARLGVSTSLAKPIEVKSVQGTYAVHTFKRIWLNPMTGDEIDEAILWPGLVQYYFAHMLRLPRGDGQGIDEYQHFLCSFDGTSHSNKVVCRSIDMA